MNGMKLATPIPRGTFSTTGMMGLGELQLSPIWVNSTHALQAARILMHGYKVRALAVMDGNRLQGILTQDIVNCHPDTALCGDVLRRDYRTFAVDMPVLHAARIFVEDELDFAAVFEGERFAGLLSANTLLRELRRSWDPLTGLGWSDRIREWAAEHLENGDEISLLFVDLDNFGIYNKTYGHTIGDRVLKKVSAILRTAINPETDLLVRYGGDEFMIGTLAPRAQAELMARNIKEHSGRAFMDEPYRPVTFTVGVSGGRRTIQRAEVHVASMVEELILVASKDCLAQKNRKDSAD